MCPIHVFSRVQNFRNLSRCICRLVQERHSHLLCRGELTMNEYLRVIHNIVRRRTDLSHENARNIEHLQSVRGSCERQMTEDPADRPRRDQRDLLEAVACPTSSQAWKTVRQGSNSGCLRRNPIEDRYSDVP
jgi:hypothetical protein